MRLTTRRERRRKRLLIVTAALSGGLAAWAVHGPANKSAQDATAVASNDEGLRRQEAAPGELARQDEPRTNQPAAVEPTQARPAPELQAMPDEVPPAAAPHVRSAKAPPSPGKAPTETEAGSAVAAVKEGVPSHIKVTEPSPDEIPERLVKPKASASANSADVMEASPSPGATSVGESLKTVGSETAPAKVDPNIEASKGKVRPREQVAGADVTAVAEPVADTTKVPPTAKPEPQVGEQAASGAPAPGTGEPSIENDKGALDGLLARHEKDRSLISQTLTQIASGQTVPSAERKRLAIVGEILAHALNRLPMQTVEGRKLQTKRVKTLLLSSRALVQPESTSLVQSAVEELSSNP